MLKLNMYSPRQYTLSMNHATMHYSGHDAVVLLVHLQCDTLQHRRELSVCLIDHNISTLLFVNAGNVNAQE